MHLYSCSENRNTALYRVCSLALKITFVRSLEMTLSSLFFFFFFVARAGESEPGSGGKVQDTLRADPFGCSVFRFYSLFVEV